MFFTLSEKKMQGLPKFHFNKTQSMVIGRINIGLILPLVISTLFKNLDSEGHEESKEELDK